MLAACGGSKKEAEAEKAAEARLAQLRARTDSIRKARTLDSLATITYTASPMSLISVNATGIVTEIAPGTGTITATSGNVTSQPFPITVN